MLQKEQLAGESVCVRVLPSSNQLVIGKDKSFTFNYVLTSKVAQVNAYCLLPVNLLLEVMFHIFVAIVLRMIYVDKYSRCHKSCAEYCLINF